MNDNIARSQNGGVTVTFEVIDPELAELYLESNEQNRNPSNLVIDSYVRDMKDNRWSIINNGIAFDVDELLIDGQHRLMAIMKSGIPQEVAVFRGLHPVDRSAIDVGRKRTAMDELRMRGVANPSALSSIARLLKTWDDGRLGRTGVKYTNNEILDYVEEHPGIVESIAAVRASYTAIGLPYSVGGAAHYRFAQQGEELANYFFERLATGEGLTGSAPLLTLRNRIIKDMNRRNRNGVDQIYLLFLVVRTWNAMCKNERLGKLLVPDREDYVGEHFPALSAQK